MNETCNLKGRSGRTWQAELSLYVYAMNFMEFEDIS